jgi:hypothetical protein
MSQSLLLNEKETEERLEEGDRQGHGATEEKLHINEKSRYKEYGLTDMATSARNREQPCPLYSFFWVIPRASNFYVPTFRNTLSVQSS